MCGKTPDKTKSKRRFRELGNDLMSRVAARCCVCVIVGAAAVDGGVVILL